MRSKHGIWIKGQVTNDSWTFENKANIYGKNEDETR